MNNLRSLTRAMLTLIVCVGTFAGSLSAFAQSSNSDPKQKTLRITTGEWEPWLSQTLPHYGLANDIVTKSFAASGIRVEFGFFDWQTSYGLTESGEWDGASIWLSTPERRKRFYYSDPVVESHIVFFARKADKFSWTTWSAIQAKRVGVVKSYSYGSAFDNAARNKRFKTVEYNSGLEAMRALARGDIDLLPSEEFVGISLIRQLPKSAMKKITYDATPIQEVSYHLLISRARTDGLQLVQLFNRGLEAARQLDPHHYVDSNFPEPDDDASTEYD